MRITALFLLAFFSYGLLRAQDISGTTVDSAGKPLPYATIALKRTADSAIAKYTASDAAGLYKFSGIPAGHYFISIFVTGYFTTNSAPFELKDNNIQLPPISAKTGRVLKEAQVTAVKPLLQVLRDKIVLNIDGNINATGEDALGLLRKSPGVTVDNNNSISLMGKNGVQIYVDNRPTYLSGAALAQYLATLQSTSIEAIEIISNPSSRYEAAGTAGIINIRLKKDKSLGTNVTAGAGYNLGTYSKYNANFSFNHRDQHLNLFGDYNYHNGTALSNSVYYRTLADSMFRQQNVYTSPGVSQTVHLGLDYFLSKKSTLGVLVGGSFATDSIRTNSSTAIIYTPTNTTTRLLIADNRTSDLHDSYIFNLNYRFTGNAGSELDLSADYGLHRIRSNQLQPNSYFDATGRQFLSGNNYNMLSPTDIDIYSFKADYTLNCWKGQLAIGGKIAYVTSANNFLLYDLLSTGKVLDSLRSDNFSYKENINAVYANYSRTFKSGLSLQAGLRVENTNSKGNSVGWQQAAIDYSVYDSAFPRHYTDLFPSASLTWKQWTLSYGRRLDRPNYQDLNPFVFKIDDYISGQGNTRLQPQYADNVNLTWSYKYALSATLNYSHIRNLFTTVPDTIDGSKTVTTAVNLASQEIIGLNLTWSFQYKWYSAYINVNGFYAAYKSNFGVSKVIDLNVFNTSILTQHSFQLGKGWSASLTELYTSPTIWQGTLRAHSNWSLDAGLQKTLFNGRATAKASVSDIFHTSNWAATSNYSGQYIYTAGYNENRQLRLSFTYRFGNIGVKAARQHITGSDEESRRVK